ncbi:MAG: cytidine deaminase [Terriglobales bacterium]
MKKRISRRASVGSAGTRQQLLRGAQVVLRRAYARYSKFRVGAAILTAKGRIYTGCNVENASYGLTNCAERTAIHSAVAREGPGMRVLAVAVVNRKESPCSPCGACRQVIFEFGPKATVQFKSKAGWEHRPISELLPYGFRFQRRKRARARRKSRRGTR